MANATTPLLGLTDTYVLGHGASALDLGALSLGSLVFNFLYWSFGFLRMATTGFVAQASGVGDEKELVLAATRPVLIGASFGLLLLAIEPVLSGVAFGLLGAEEHVERVARTYVRARISGAPFALVALGGTGLLIGLGHSKLLLLVQLATNGANILLDVFFVWGLGWGLEGVGWGTAIAEGFGGVFVVFVGTRRLGLGRVRWPGWGEVVDPAGLRRTFSANWDIMVRTLAMIASFSYFTDRGARYGTEVLAANHLLLQFVSFSAFFLDGFAHVAEARVGAAFGARDSGRFDTAVRATSEVALYFALALSGAILLVGAQFVDVLTDLTVVRQIADRFLPLSALYVGVSVLAFQLDGVFIGMSATRAMRNCSLISAAAFFLLVALLTPTWKNGGLWSAFIGYVVVRGLTLLVALPRLRATVAGRGRS